ncbi:hypothetical protein GCM10010522_18390 [Kribbella solani]
MKNSLFNCAFVRTSGPGGSYWMPLSTTVIAADAVNGAIATDPARTTAAVAAEMSVRKRRTDNGIPFGSGPMSPRPDE